MIYIFDFDLTVTKKHSFRTKRIEMPEPPETWYVAGKNAANEGAVRLGIGEFLKHDAENLSAIATFHNNPDYVAGHIAHILGKELVLSETLLSNGTPKVAINVYAVEGSRPFLISHLPYEGQEFNVNTKALGNKNSQIEFLRATWIRMGLAQESNVINFYDDSGENFQAAVELGYVSGNLVNKESESFAISMSFEAKGQKDVPSHVGWRQQLQMPSTNISMAVLSGFIAVTGIAAVAIAFAVFNAAALNPVGLTLAVVGAVNAVVGGLGFFVRSSGASAENDDQNLLNSPASAAF